MDHSAKSAALATSRGNTSAEESVGVQVDAAAVAAATSAVDRQSTTSASTVMRSRNIRKLWHHAADVINTAVYVTMLQETDVPERDVAALTNTFRDSGQHILWSEASPISHGSKGRRAAIVTQSIAAPVRPTREIDDNARWLSASGRWVEALIPVGSDDGFVYVASLYGIPGASDPNTAAYKENEALLAAVLVRAAHFSGLPSFIGTDLNCCPDDSAVLQLARTHERAFDIVADRTPQPLPPTYNRCGVYVGMSGKGVSRIDTVLANRVGANAVTAIEHRFDVGRGYDHVALDVHVSHDAFADEMRVPRAPAPISFAVREDMNREENKR